MIKLLKKIYGEIILISGVGLFTYNFFNFTSYIYPKERGLRSFDGPTEWGGVSYYYEYETLIPIAIAAMLIAAGILIIRNKK